MNYIFVQEILKKLLVVDFEGFLLGQGYLGLYPYEVQAPDFIVSDIGLSTIALIESKGSCPKEKGIKLKTTLRSGLEQCDKAQQYFIKNKLPIKIKSIFVSGIWFSAMSNAWNTSLNFADPEYNNNIIENVKDPLNLFRYDYTLWF